MFRNFITILAVCVASSSFAQQANTLAPDQNPNYMISQTKYMNQKDSLLSNENITVQDTYKAYDWREARDEKRNERRTYRREQSYLNNSYYPTPSINYGWNSGYNYGYNGSYNNYNYYNRNGWSISRPFIGFRTGNWWFGF